VSEVAAKRKASNAAASEARAALHEAASEAQASAEVQLGGNLVPGDDESGLPSTLTYFPSDLTTPEDSDGSAGDGHPGERVPNMQSDDYDASSWNPYDGYDLEEEGEGFSGWLCERRRPRAAVTSSPSDEVWNRSRASLVKLLVDGNWFRSRRFVASKHNSRN